MHCRAGAFLSDVFETRDGGGMFGQDPGGGDKVGGRECTVIALMV